jgi:hypothetical protein
VLVDVVEKGLAMASGSVRSVGQALGFFICGIEEHTHLRIGRKKKDRKGGSN